LLDNSVFNICPIQSVAYDPTAMKKALLLVLAQAWAMTCLAQPQTTKNSIRIGIDFIKIDAPDATGPRYQLRYTRHLFRDRLLVGASFGYFNKNGRQNLYHDVYVPGHQQRRWTSDFSILADLLASPTRALRLGGGPSLWYRQDNLWLRIKL
jgi:hypothetical protein